MTKYIHISIGLWGHEDEIARVLSEIRGDDVAVDFNRLIPMPDAMEIEVSERNEIAFAMNCDKKLRVIIKKREDFQRACKTIGSPTTSNEFKQLAERGVVAGEFDFASLWELGERLRANKAKYGSQTWQDWCFDNWGTKWNAVHSKVTWEPSRHAKVEFLAADSMPEPYLRKLIHRYPDIHFVGFARHEFGSLIAKFDDVSITYSVRTARYTWIHIAVEEALRREKRFKNASLLISPTAQKEAVCAN